MCINVCCTFCCVCHTAPRLAKRSTGHTSGKQSCLELFWGARFVCFWGTDSSLKAGAERAMVSGQLVGGKASGRAGECKSG